MQDNIIILKNPKNGIVRDTLMSIQDTLRLDLKQEFILPKEDVLIHTISEPLTGIAYWGLWIAALAGIIGIIAGIKALKNLFKKDAELQSQINELVKLNKLFEKRVRMTVKPHLWTNGSGHNGSDYTIYIQLDNRGEIGFYTGFETLEGDGSFMIHNWNQAIAIEKDKYIRLSGKTVDHPNQTYFKIKVKYYDKEDYHYETIIEWNKGKVRFIETIAL